MSAFLVERNLPGVSVGKHENKMGLRTNSTCDVIFEDVRVPKRNLVGEEGKGYQIAMKTLERSRPLGSATSVSASPSSISASNMQMTVSYSANRWQQNRQSSLW